MIFLIVLASFIPVCIVLTMNITSSMNRLNSEHSLEEQEEQEVNEDNV